MLNDKQKQEAFTKVNDAISTNVKQTLSDIMEKNVSESDKRKANVNAQVMNMLDDALTRNGF